MEFDSKPKNKKMEFDRSYTAFNKYIII